VCYHNHEAPSGACCGNCLRWIAKADRGTGRCNNIGGFRVGTIHIELDIDIYCPSCLEDIEIETVGYDIDWVEILTTHDFCCNRYQGSY